MNKEKSASILGKLLGWLLAGFISGGGLGGYAVYQYHVDKLAEISQTVGQLHEQLKNEKYLNQNSKTILAQKDKQISDIKNDLDALTEKWNIVTRTGGIAFVLNTVDSNSHKVQLKIKDQIEIQSVSFVFSISVIRVTDEGPIIKVNGCQHFQSRNTYKSLKDGDSAFLLKPGCDFTLTFTSASCQSGDLLSDAARHEEITMSPQYFNVDAQSLELRIQRKFIVRN